MQKAKKIVWGKKNFIPLTGVFHIHILECPLVNKHSNNNPPFPQFIFYTIFYMWFNLFFLQHPFEIGKSECVIPVLQVRELRSKEEHFFVALKY